MNSLILQTAARFLLILMLLFSFWVLLRGHNSPGGGFIGGLIAASAFALYLIAYGVRQFKILLIIELPIILGLGLMCILVSGLIPLLHGKLFLTGIWYSFLSVNIGSPLLFDLGIYFVVVSSILIILYALEKES
ncbi:Na+/H+ antiporter subunit B [Legionella clemsonensis]|uniref:Na(+)/H(+) antiporter subunit B n=1 Tax=Legionella clemsonensis TaxID=1867846 RepID=A0A222P1L1_9GAMM|nr:Na+/H+ antiporter subunit B [Legionella clemsonensis]ASQ45748.1 Na(+)/H(+) antiporter subunit B [Legionella clemsonensis]